MLDVRFKKIWIMKLNHSRSSIPGPTFGMASFSLFRKTLDKNISAYLEYGISNKAVVPTRYTLRVPLAAHR